MVGISDLVRLLQAQTEALASLPGTLVSLNKSVRGLGEAVTAFGDTARTVQRLASRADALLDELEGPLRELAPGLSKVAGILNEPIIDEIPKQLTALSQDVLPIVRGLAETQSKVAGIAATTDRMMSLVDDLQTRVGQLPGANLLSRRKAPAKP